MASKTIEIEGIDEQVKQLRRMMSEDPYFRRRVNAVIKTVLSAARKEVMQHAEGAMDSDPRHAYKAVRSAVYRRILGGNLNILSRRKAGAPTSYQKPRRGTSDPKGRGGNRWGRSQRTIDLESYEGMDRGFILRFLNAGASDRAIKTYSDKNGDRFGLRTWAKGGNRGNIAARNWFGNASQAALEKVSIRMEDFIDKIINEEFV
jgi:hypothetical protein